MRMENRGNQFGMRDIYNNMQGISTSEFTTPEEVELNSYLDADSNTETIAEMRAGGNQYSIMLAFALLVGLVVLGGWAGIR